MIEKYALTIENLFKGISDSYLHNINDSLIRNKIEPYEILKKMRENKRLFNEPDSWTESIRDIIDERKKTGVQKVKTHVPIKTEALFFNGENIEEMENFLEGMVDFEVQRVGMSGKEVGNILVYRKGPSRTDAIKINDYVVKYSNADVNTGLYFDILTKKEFEKKFKIIDK